MAGLDPQLAAMTRQASQLLAGAGRVQAAPGTMVQTPTTGQLLPSSFLGNRVDQLAPLAALASPVNYQRSGPAALASAAAYRQQRQAELQLALSQLYVGGGGGGGGSGIDMQDFVYGATVPQGYSDEAIYQAARESAPAYRQAVPMHIMNQGMVQDNQISIKYKMPDGTTNTIWVPLR